MSKGRPFAAVDDAASLVNPSRRQMMSLAAAAAASPLLPRSASAADSLEPTVVTRTTGGMFEAALKRNFFDPFTAATGVRVVPVAASYGDMMAKSAAMQAADHVEWDIISPQFTELDTISQYLDDPLLRGRPRCRDRTREVRRVRNVRAETAQGPPPACR